MPEPTDADRERASALLDDITFGGYSQDGAIETTARALADERERARAPFLALADQYDAHRAKLTADGTWKTPLPFLELAAEDIRAAAQEDPK